MNRVLQDIASQIIVKSQCLDVPINLLIDTGASASLVNTSFIKHNNLLTKVKSTNKQIAGLDNKIVPIQGEIILPIILGNYKTKHVFLLCEHL